MKSFKTKQSVLTLGLLTALGINASWSPLITTAAQVAHLSSGASGPHASLAAQPVKTGGEPGAGPSTTQTTSTPKPSQAATGTTTTVKAAPTAPPKASDDKNVNPPTPGTKPAPPAEAKTEPPTPSQNAAAPAAVDPANAQVLAPVDTSTKTPPAPVTATTQVEEAPKVVATPTSDSSCVEQSDKVFDRVTGKTVYLRLKCYDGTAIAFDSSGIEGQPPLDNGLLCVDCKPDGMKAQVVQNAGKNSLAALAAALQEKYDKAFREAKNDKKEDKKEEKKPTPCIAVTDKIAKAQCYAEQLEALASEETASKLDAESDRPWARTDAILKALRGDNKDFPGLKGLASAMEDLKNAAAKATKESEAKELGDAAERVLDAFKVVKERYKTSSLGDGYKYARDAVANARTLEKIIPAETKLAETRVNIEKEARNLVAEEAKVEECFARENRGRTGYNCDMQDLRLQQKKWALQAKATQQVASTFNSTNTDLLNLFSRLGTTQRESLMPRVSDLESLFNDQFMDYTLNFSSLYDGAGRTSSGGNSRLGRVRDANGSTRSGSGRYGVPRSSVANTGARDIIQTADGTYMRVNGTNTSNSVNDARMRDRDARVRAAGGVPRQ